jgi:heat-inducible transcriptional repressor
MSHKPSSIQQINQRAQRLLKLLVSRYIRDGQPIGSRTLSKEIELDLSPATIRNVMADLEEMGLVSSPHTSAGRIPTALGYRLFVDSLLHVDPLSDDEIARLRHQLSQEDEQHPFKQASQLLSEVTQLASVVTLPHHDSNRLRHVEFLPLSDRRVLVIVVVNEHEVQNRIIHTSRSYTASELEQAANYLNAAFTGKDIKAVREGLLREMQETRATMDQMMQTTIEMAEKVFIHEDTEKRDFVMSGQTNLMGAAQLSDVDKLRHLFEVFGQKRDILHLLDQAIKAQGVKIFIGEESGYDVLEECSVVMSPYMINGEVIGVLGVIGPIRMRYDRVIPIVDLTAKLLSSLLEPPN